MCQPIGILLVNLGTPASPTPRDIFRYLLEFLTDKRVIDLPWIKRHLLVRGIIIPTRLKQSTASYKRVWTEKGSPLMVFGKSVEEKLGSLLGSDYVVKLAMRYQKPSLEEGLQALIQAGVKKIIVLPLFPQYASATTGSVHQRLMELIKNFNVIPEITFLNNFADHPAFIQAFAELAKPYSLPHYDHILFSYHGLPESHLIKADRLNHCLKKENCCHTYSKINRNCYSAQCHATTKAIAESLHLDSKQYSLAFQSRLGKDPWLEPYTSDVIADLAKKGQKRILVFCPSFVCDCLETLYEIGEEYALEFRQAGGESLELVKGLNDHPFWIQALKTILEDADKDSYKKEYAKNDCTQMLAAAKLGS